MIFARGGRERAARTCGLLRRWWDADFKRFHFAKPWEQAAMQGMYLYLQGKANKTAKGEPPTARLRTPWGSRVRLLPTARFFRRAESQWLRLGAEFLQDEVRMPRS